MKVIIPVLFVIYISLTMVIEKTTADIRFPVDTRRIQATLNESDIIYLWYSPEENNTEIIYHPANSEYTCKTQKLEKDRNSVFSGYFHLTSLNQEKILVIPMVHDSNYNEYPAAIEIIHLPSCQRTEVQLPDKKPPTEFRITRYPDSFDIYYKDSSKCLKNYCRTAYDFEGNVISPSFSEFISNKSIPLIKLIGSDERSNKYLAFEFTEEKTMVNLVDSGSVKLLAETNKTEFVPEVSASNNLISIFYRTDFGFDENQEPIYNSKLIQFDLNGNLKFETVVAYEAPIRTARMVNTPNGGVYVVASPCDRDHCTDEQNIYYVRKIDANGKEVGSGFSWKLISPGIIEDLSFFQSGKSYCLHRAQVNLGVSGTWQFKALDTTAKCFTDEDFE